MPYWDMIPLDVRSEFARVRGTVKPVYKNQLRGKNLILMGRVFLWTEALQKGVLAALARGLGIEERIVGLVPIEFYCESVCQNAFKVP